jgi:diguanylate cyclase
MIPHDPSLVILSTTIAILGAFTACVTTSNLATLGRSESRLRLIMASLTLGGSLWAVHFVGLLALEVPINFAQNPLLLTMSAVVAFSGVAIALFLVRGSGSTAGARLPVSVAILGITIAATHYFGIAAIAGRGLHLSWFLTLISIAVSIQVAGITLWFLFQPRGVVLTLIGAIGLGLCLSATHYLSIASAEGFEQTLLSLPPYDSGISERYLAWSATIMMYLLCSICLCVFVVMQFRDEIE